MEYNKELHEKAKRKLEEKVIMKEYVKDCLAAHICPNCGSEVTLDSMVFSSETKYTCSNCGFYQYE